MPSASSPAVTIRVVFAAGSADDPAGREGLTQLAVRLMLEGGTESLSYPELLRALFPMAAEISWNVDRDQTLVYARVPAALLDKFYPLLLDVLTRPRMDADDFERLRAISLSELEDDLKVGDDEELGKEALEAFLYEGHPYGHPTVGTAAGLAAMTLDDVRAHRERVLCSGRVTLGVAGGFPEGFDARVASDLAAGLPASCAPVTPLPPPPSFSGRQVLIVDKPGNSATAISIGFPEAVVRGDPDFPALALALVHFGQHRQFVGRLMQQIREKRGFNYGDYAYPEHFVQEGWERYPAVNVARRQQLFSIWIRPVDPGNAHFVLRLAMRELETFVAGGIPDADLERIRTFALGYFNLYRQTESRRLGYAIDDLVLGLDKPFLDGLLDAWPSLDAGAVRRAVARAVTSENVKIAIVAPDGAALADALAADGPSPVEYDTPKSDDILAEDAVTATFPLRIPRENIRVLPVSNLFSR
ncbi:MAG: insulinase family protein [Deltaproteobacteria bacterium]|nr:insulinase family protein [Deltaproteobacteria bacterium]